MAPRTVPLAAVLVLVLLVGGVATAGTATYFVLTHGKSTSGPKAHPAPAAHNLNLTDDLGRAVEVPLNPARIAVLGPSIMDSVYRLGLRSHVVAVDCYAASFGGLTADYSPDQVSLWNLSAGMCVQVGPTFVPEMLANASPQLVLASTIVSVAAVEQITGQLGIPVVMLQPPTVSGILVDDTLLGSIFNVSGPASALNGELSAELSNATKATGGASSNPTVLLTYDADANGYWTFGPGSFGLSLIELAGGSSVSGNSTTPYPELAPAQVLWDDPSRIVYGVGFGYNLTTYEGGADWNQFGAVKAGNISGIDSNWITEADPTMILDGVPALLAVLHPTGA